MFDAYLDESGIHEGAAVCVIAGYFGGRGKWKKFDDDWLKLLDNFNVPRERFHASKLVPKPKGWFLDRWDGDHSAFMDAIGNTIAKHNKIHPIAAGIVVDDFNSFPEDARKYLTGATIKRGRLTSSGSPNKPYFVTFQRCVIEICEAAPVGGKAHFFFGLDRPFAGYAGELFKQIKASDLQGEDFAAFRVGWKDRLGNASFPLAKETPQLQAADFLVNLTYHHMLEAGSAIGTAQPSPLLAQCISNRRKEQSSSEPGNVRRTI